DAAGSRTGTSDRLDLGPRPARGLANLAILGLDDLACRLVAVETAERGDRNLAIRALGPILVKHVEQGELPDGQVLAGHGASPSTIDVRPPSGRTRASYSSSRIGGEGNFCRAVLDLRAGNNRQKIAP